MKKFFSLALALVMLLSLCALGASAESYEEKTVEVNWNFGYVGSSTNSGGFVNMINPNGGNYSYSDAVTFDCVDGEIYTTIYEDYEEKP